jgi:hypothetical protein
MTFYKYDRNVSVKYKVYNIILWCEVICVFVLFGIYFRSVKTYTLIFQKKKYYLFYSALTYMIFGTIICY